MTSTVTYAPARSFEEDFEAATKTLDLNRLIPEDRALELSLSLSAAPGAAPLEAIPTLESENHFGLKTLLNRVFTKEFRARLKKTAPWLITGGILGLDLILHAPLFVLGGTIAALTVKILKSIIKSNPLCQKLWRNLLDKAGIPEHKVPWLTLSFGAGSWLSAAMPSHALFFQAAETYVQKIFQLGGGAAGGTNVTTFVPLIFGVLRVIFCIYLGIALVRVVSAFRNDEDWTTAARVPVIVVLCVVIGDSLSSLITAGGP